MAEQKYDVVVIGGGMGGMCAGALAVKEGLRPGTHAPHSPTYHYYVVFLLRHFDTSSCV